MSPNIYATTYLKEMERQQKEENFQRVQKNLQEARGSEPSALTRERIFEVVADWYKVPISIFSDKTRKKIAVEARHIAWRLTREFVRNLTLSEIGGGIWDHTSILYAIRAIKDRMDTEPGLAKNYKDIESILKEPAINSEQEISSDR